MSTLAPGEALRGGLSTTTRRITQRWQAVAAALLIVAALGLAVHLIARQSEASAYASGIAREAGAIEDRLAAQRFGPDLPPFTDILPSLNGLSALAGREPGTKAEANAAIPQLEADAQAAYGAGLDRLFVPYLMAGLQATLGQRDDRRGRSLSHAETLSGAHRERPLSSIDLAALGDRSPASGS